MRRHRNSGFFIIFGHRVQESADGSRMFQGVCPSCGRVCWMQGRKSQRWFSLFFVSLIPMGIPSRYSQCCSCGSRFNQTLEELRRTLQMRNQIVVSHGSSGQAAISGTQSQAGRLAGAGNRTALPGANSASNVLPAGQATPAALRDESKPAPMDPATLASLLNASMEKGKPEEALRTAKANPDARDASDACLVLVAKAYLQIGERDRALLSASAALALNPENAQAALLRTTLLGPDHISTPGPAETPARDAGGTNALAHWAQRLETDDQGNGKEV